MGADGDADAGLPATAPGTPAGWRLVFQDDFSGSAVDTTQWGMYDSPGHDGNGLRTEPDPSGATSGVVLTWPQNGNWPADGENDIYETGTGTSRASFSTFIHYGADNRQYHDKHAVDATQWHIVAMEWEANALRIYRDGALVWTLTDANAIPDVAHHLCIQLGAFRTIMGDPVKMYVDWAKIYQRRGPRPAMSITRWPVAVRLSAGPLCGSCGMTMQPGVQPGGQESNASHGRGALEKVGCLFRGGGSRGARAMRGHFFQGARCGARGQPDGRRRAGCVLRWECARGRW